MRGWQWMFLIEAVPAVLLGILVLFLLNNGIREARMAHRGGKAPLGAE
jgi:MFS family permease